MWAEPEGLRQRGLRGMTEMPLQGRWSFSQVLAFLETRAVQLDWKKQMRQTMRKSLKHLATEESRSEGMSLMATKETSLGWYFLTFFGFIRGEIESGAAAAAGGFLEGSSEE